MNIFERLGNKFSFTLQKLLSWIINTIQFWLIQKISPIQLDVVENEPFYSNKTWHDHQLLLLNRLKEENISNFLQFPTIRETMFFNNRHLCNLEFVELQKSPYWDIYWQKIVDPPFGYPLRYLKRLKTSCNSLHHAYHLDKFLNFSGIRDFNNFETIIEFGGGYGNLCRIIHLLGFKNEYILFDLPIFSSIQRMYISNTCPQSCKNISFFSNPRQIESISINKNTLFIATWSLSETPIQQRSFVEKIIKNSDYGLLALQNNFEDEDNIKYFNHLIKNGNDSKIWKISEIKHLPENYYLFGKPS